MTRKDIDKKRESLRRLLAMGYFVNAYTGKCHATGMAVPAGSGVCRRDGGKQSCYTIEAAAELELAGAERA